MTRSPNSAPSVGRRYRNRMYTALTVGRKRTIGFSVNVATNSDPTGRSVRVVVDVQPQLMSSINYNYLSMRRACHTMNPEQQYLFEFGMNTTLNGDIRLDNT